MADEKAVIEIPNDPAPVKVETPTLEEVQAAGVSAAEMEMVKKHGLAVEKKEPEKKPEVPPEEKKPVVESKPNGKVPDDQLPDGFKDWTPNERGLYKAQKIAEAKRKRAELEKEQAILRARSLERELEDLRKRPATETPTKSADEMTLDDLLGEGKAKKDEAKPLTRDDLEKIEKEKEEKALSEVKGRELKAEQLRVKLREFEIDAQEKMEDFDDAANAAREILTSGQEIFKDDPERLELAQYRAERALAAMANALDWKEGQKTPAELVYELGKLHPKYRNGGKKTADPETVPAEKLDRMLENAGKRSSASLASGGGSRRAVSEDELTLEDAAKLTPAQYSKLSKKTRERLLRM